jgi:hypothetical protein
MAGLRDRLKPMPRPEIPIEAKVQSSITRMRARTEAMGDSRLPDIHRITNLPVVLPMLPEEQEGYNQMNLLSSAYADGFRLFPIQCDAVAAYEKAAGGFFPIGVGWGKTLITLMIANKAFQKGLSKIMLMVPPQVYAQLTEHDIKWARQRVPITYPIITLGNLTPNKRIAKVKSGRIGLYIMPYSLLSVQNTDDMLDAISPECVICDEAHNLKRMSAARTRRFLSMVKKCEPELVCLSGTITAKSVMDYLHLIRICLGQNCPLPLAMTVAQEWASVIDAAGTADDTTTGPLLPLVRWAETHFPNEDYPMSQEGFRRAYRVRMNTCPGVASSGDSDIGTSLVFANEPVAEGPNDDLVALIKQVDRDYITPNGDEIEHAIHKFKWLYELSAGFYNMLVWPSPSEYAARKGITETEAVSILDRAREHHRRGQEYAKDLREWIEANARPGLDTPFLVGSDMDRHGPSNVGMCLYAVWRQWKDADFEGRPGRDSHAVRVDPWKVRAAAEWAKSLGSGCILWYHHQEIGRWLAELLAEEDALHCPAGERFNRAIVDPSNQNRIVIASMTAHGTGKNLQHFQHQFFVQWPRPASVAEQTLGRTHRNGQEADELRIVTCNTIDFDYMNFAACLNDALYIHQSTGNRQKLVYGTYDPMPRIFPHAVLREQGYQPSPLSPQQEKALRERFA